MRRIRHTTAIYKELPSSAVTTSSYLTGPLAEAMADGRIPPDAVPPGVIPEIDAMQPQPSAQTPAYLHTPTNLAPFGTNTSPQLATSMLPTLPDDDEEEELVRPSPTLTAKAWRLAFVMLSKARKGAWDRVHSRTSSSARSEPRDPQA